MCSFCEHDYKSRSTNIAAHTLPRVHPSAREIPAHPLFEERLPRSVGKPVGPFNLSGAGVDQSRFDSGLCISAEKRIVAAAIGARARSVGHLITFIRNGDVAGVLSRSARRLNSDCYTRQTYDCLFPFAIGRSPWWD